MASSQEEEEEDKGAEERRRRTVKWLGLTQTHSADVCVRPYTGLPGGLWGSRFLIWEVPSEEGTAQFQRAQSAPTADRYRRSVHTSLGPANETRPHSSDRDPRCCSPQALGFIWKIRDLKGEGKLE
ncbi:hypothetical protein AGOR_G00237000 [Albula goreensis]|uniref:Uncharacterized protein n=1 Tax=Albula goreensis TaxID=1534307 RepID=A0A8T3CCJ8_9TELE|nr:hypothetical protein AGOR_G00237000 [Albula goreensis]